MSFFSSLFSFSIGIVYHVRMSAEDEGNLMWGSADRYVGKREKRRGNTHWLVLETLFPALFGKGHSGEFGDEMRQLEVEQMVL